MQSGFEALPACKRFKHHEGLVSYSSCVVPCVLCPLKTPHHTSVTSSLKSFTLESSSGKPNTWDGDERRGALRFSRKGMFGAES